MKTTRRDGPKADVKLPLPKAEKADVSKAESSAPPAAENVVDPRKALRALALDNKVEAKKKPNAGASAATLGTRLMGFFRGESGKKAMAMAGLGMSLLGMSQPAAADVVVIQQQGDGQTLASATAGPASPWLVDHGGGAPAKSPQATLLQAMTEANQKAQKPDLRLTLADSQKLNAAEIMFTVPSEMREVKDGQSVFVPLEAGREIHMIELRYHDSRPLKDFEFNRRAPGGQWETFRGDEYAASETKEKAGELEIKREPDHHGMWVNNPIRVKVDVVNDKGEVIHSIGKKFVDPQLHDAWGPDSPGSAEIDNISNGYEKLPQGKLPAGSFLRLTPVHENKKPWEADRQVAMELSWVKPIYMPEHTERVHVRQGDWEKPKAEGYDVQPGRPIAAVLVKWTDHGGTSSGSVRLTRPDGTTFTTTPSNVGSGETELIPLDGHAAKDGKIFIEGWGIEVGNIEVLYR